MLLTLQKIQKNPVFHLKGESYDLFVIFEEKQKAELSFLLKLKGNHLQSMINSCINFFQKKNNIFLCTSVLMCSLWLKLNFELALQIHLKVQFQAYLNSSLSSEFNITEMYIMYNSELNITKYIDISLLKQHRNNCDQRKK